MTVLLQIAISHALEVVWGLLLFVFVSLDLN